MSRSEALLALVLLGAAGLVAYGVWLIHEPASFIVGGALLAVIALLFLDDGKGAKR